MRIIMLVLLSSFSSISMKASQPPSQRINASVVAALKSFDVDAQEIEIKKTETPTPDSPDLLSNWDTKSSTIYISEHLASYSPLLTFTAYCTAAHLKNKSSIKSKTADLVATFAPTLTFGAASAIASENLGIGAFVGCAVSVLCKRFGLQEKIQDRYYKQAYADACQKLIDDNKIPVIAAYAAYSELIKHNPLDAETRIDAIKKTLEDAGYALDIETKPNMRAVLIKKKESDILIAKSSIEFIDREHQSFKFTN